MLAIASDLWITLQSDFLTRVKDAGHKSTERLAKSERRKDLGADRVLGYRGSLTEVGDE
jgi:hypothetical protein